MCGLPNSWKYIIEQVHLGVCMEGPSVLIHVIFEVSITNYPLVIQHSYGESASSMGKSTISGPFSIARLVIARVSYNGTHLCWGTPIGGKPNRYQFRWPDWNYDFIRNHERNPLDMSEIQTKRDFFSLCGFVCQSSVQESSDSSCPLHKQMSVDRIHPLFSDTQIIVVFIISQCITIEILLWV